MVTIGRVGPPAGSGPGPRRAASPGFAVAPPASGPVAGPAAASPAVALDGMLALQQAEGETVRDREARRHGQGLLDALARLQRSLLAEGSADAELAALATLLDTMPAASAPALAAALGAVALRARVELARRGL